MAKKTKECKYGAFTFYDNDHWIGGALDRVGEYSGEECDFLIGLLKPGDVVVEVGANIGALTIPMAKAIGPNGAFFAFEPQPETFALLQQNVFQNGLSSSVKALKMAVGAECCEVAIVAIPYEKPDINAGSVTLVPLRDDGQAQHKVWQTTLDFFLMGKPRLDLLKVDVEGAEIAVLDGAGEAINFHRPLIYIENDRQDKSPELITRLRELGYVCFWHFPKLFNPDPMDRGDHESGFVSANMVCAPEARAVEFADNLELRKVAGINDDWHLALTRMDERKVAAGVKPRRTAQAKRNDWACVVRLGGVGDNLITSAVLPFLRAKYGRLEVIASEPQHVVFENNPHIDKLTVKEQGDPPWQDGHGWQRHWLARSREYAFFANLSHTCETYRALTPIQTQYYWGASVRRKICGQSYLEAVADVCEVPYDQLEPRFYPTEREIEDAAETRRLVGGRYIGWVLSGSRIDKVWPPAAITIARLIKETGVPIIMLGGPGRDFEMAKQIGEHVAQANGSQQGLHLALTSNADFPNWPIRRILAQTMAADVVVTPDTGPAWAVAMLDMPKIVMLSHAGLDNITKHWRNTTTLHADPNRVPCWPCHLLIDEPAACERLSGRRGGNGAACISDIAPDVVVSHVKAALGGAPKFDIAAFSKAAE